MCDQMSIAFGEKQTLVEKFRKLERLSLRIDEQKVHVKVKESAIIERSQRTTNPV